MTSTASDVGKTRALFLVLFSYVVALLAAIFTGWLVHGYLSPLWVAAVADAVGTVAIFGFSRLFDNSSFYDPYWSVAPIPIAIYFAWLGDAPIARQLLVIGLVTLWGVRLTFNWARGWTGLAHEDWRYVDFRRSQGKRYWLVSFAGIHALPSVLVFLGLLPVWAALMPRAASSGALSMLEIVGALVTLGATAIEAIADQQLRAHVRDPNRDPKRTFQGGLWAYSRHPNYFGELGFWWGLFIVGLAADVSRSWIVIGALSLTALFWFISIPMIDQRMLSRRDDYSERMRCVSPLVPWFAKPQKQSDR
jgi:steroid 5-alpha reductase family enzyme